MSADGRTLGILISGRGTNLQAMLDAIREKRLSARVGLVLSNVAGAAGLRRAEEASVPTAVISHRDYATREAFDAAMVAALRKSDVDIVCLAGFMRLLSPAFIREFPGRIVNIHPSLLPAFPGLHAQRQSLEYGVKVAGCTVHLVDEELDHGPILLQSAVAVEDDDTEDSLAARILAEEHRLYPQAIQLLVDGKIEVRGRRAVIRA